jgi:3-deoxy-manno-octulosonate cytidylyltransferase (CMP-KDO synthetase)
MKAAIVIPARYASTRLAVKPLLEAAGKPLIRHVWERAKKTRRAAAVIIATDDERIASVCRSFGADVAMTKPECASGTERVAEAARSLDADIVVNLQGDEPEIDPAHIDRLLEIQENYVPFASTLACPFPKHADPADPANVKAVLGRRIADGVHEALYFTRALAPHPYRQEANDKPTFHLHIGIYAFRRESLLAFAEAKPSRLETIERLEQLRILEMGEKIAVGLVDASAPGVDTPQDFAAFKMRIEGGARP